jgi:hypothetical protein
LQSRTLEYLRTRHSPKDSEDGTSSTTAFYSRDEVSGPLSGAEGKEEVFDLQHDDFTISVDKKPGKAVKEAVKMIREDLMTPSEQDVR